MPEHVTSADRHDIAACLAGDQAAYAQLMGRYQAQVFQQMWRFTRDADVQEELVQEAFIEVYRSLGGFKGQAPFLHWIRRIGTRVGYRYWKRKARDTRLRDSIAEHKHEFEAPPEAQEPSDAAEQLHGLLATLPAKDRLILTLMYFEDCDASDVAERMGWSANLVRVRAHRARQKLRKMLEELGFGRP